MPKARHFTRSVIFYFIVILLATMTVPFTLVLVATSFETREFERDRAAEYLGSNTQIIASTIDSRLHSIESGLTELLLNNAFRNAVTELPAYKTPIEFSDFLAMRTIRSGILSAAIRSRDIRSVYLYAIEAERLFISNLSWDPAHSKISLHDTPWFQVHVQNEGNHPWNITTALESDETMISCYRVLEKYKHPPAGLLSVNVKLDVVLDTINNAKDGTGNTSVVIDSFGSFLYDDLADADLVAAVIENLPKTSQSGTFELEYDSASVFAAYYISEYSGFTYVQFSPLSQIQGATERIANITVIYVATSVLVLLFCIVLVYYFFFRPIHSLANGMKRFEKGDFSVRMKENRSDEIGLINNRFNKMVENIDTLINENYVNELLKRDIQLKYTQNQLNEHFLYNTLDSIHWLSNKHNTPDIGDMIKALANFYRTSLSNGRDLITIGEVADMISAYLYLQGIRFGDDLTYSINFDDELKHVLVPKHLFLPLVENSIGHGVSGRPDGVISVSLTKSDVGVRFSVMDNGRGIGDERLDEIMSHLKSNEVSLDDSFALRNVNTQLEQYFDNTDGVQIDTINGIGTTVWFDMYPEEGSTNDEDGNS